MWYVISKKDKHKNLLQTNEKSADGKEDQEIKTRGLRAVSVGRPMTVIKALR